LRLFTARGQALVNSGTARFSGKSLLFFPYISRGIEMQKSLVLAAVVAALALSACGKKDEAAVEAPVAAASEVAPAAEAVAPAVEHAASAVAPAAEAAASAVAPAAEAAASAVAPAAK